MSVEVGGTTGTRSLRTPPTAAEQRGSVGSIDQTHQILTTRVGLRFPAQMSFALWARAGSHLYRVTDSSIWCLADWLVFGQDEYPDRYRQAVEVAKLDYQTLRNYAWVARRFDWSRRRGTLSFQHHAEVAALSAEEQDHWLHLAEKNNWSRNKLRVNLRKHRAESEQVPPAVVLPRLPASDEQMDRWRRAAAQAGHTFSAWVVNALDAAASSTK